MSAFDAATHKDFQTTLFTFHPHRALGRKIFMRAHNRDHAIGAFANSLGLTARTIGSEQDDGSGATYQDIEIGTGARFSVYATPAGETEHGR